MIERLHISEDDLSRINVVSFDIFNTVLMRDVVDPRDIFPSLGRRLDQQGLLPKGISPEYFATVREEVERTLAAEKKAQGKEDYYLREVYERFPFFFGLSPEAAVNNELETEKAHSWRNPIIYELLLALRQRGKRLIAISDMYFDREQIRGLLEHSGVDSMLFSEIRVSCEYGCHKRDGKLFNAVFEELGIRADEVIHIGDDIPADVLGPGLAGAKGIHYDIFENIPTSLVYERYCFHSGVRELYSLRLVCYQAMTREQRQDFWYTQGALIWGPVLTLYAEWVLQFAEDNRITHIYPQMREGILIEKLIRGAIELNPNYRDRIKEFDLCRMYVSRDTTFLARYESFNEDVFDYLLRQVVLSIGAMFEILGIPEDAALFEAPESMQLKDYIGHPGGREQLWKYLNEPSRLRRINTWIREKREKLYQYLTDNLDIEHDFITCDLGYGGNATDAVRRALQANGKKVRVVGCFVITNSNAIPNVINGCELHGFLQEFSDRTETLEKYSSFLEPLFMDETGGTYDYQENHTDGRMEPLLHEPLTDPVVINRRSSFHQGVLDFQKLYYESHVETHPLDLSTSACNLVRRLFMCPTAEEASQYMQQVDEQNFGGLREGDYRKKTENIEDQIAFCKKESPEQFIKQAGKLNAIWPEGIIARAKPAWLFEYHLKQGKGVDRNSTAMLSVCDRLQEDEISSVIVYGAGEAGKLLGEFLMAYQIRILCYVDRNERLWGKNLSGASICSLPDAVQQYPEAVWAIGSLAWIDEIKATIEKEKAEARIYAN